MVNEDLIINILERNNKWWKEEFKLNFKPREIYENIKKFMHTKQIISLTGLRRVGKTTLMWKIILDSLEKIDKNNIVYFSFDELKDIKIKDIMEIYAKLMKKELTKEKYLFLLDEIQKLDGWEEQIKRIYDEHPNIKFVISGSESLFIRKKMRESLAGRMFEFKIEPLNFREFLMFRGKSFQNIKLYEKEILREFDNFLLCNGFPEIVDEEKEIIEKYIKDNIIEKIIYRDIPQIISIREPSVLENLLRIILHDPGEMININELAKELNVSRQTISLYLDYLEKSFLIKKLYNFSKNARKSQRKLKKYYPTIISPDIIGKKDMIGKVFETAMILQLKAEFFWRDAYKNEVDIIKLNNDIILPVEIKYSKIECRGLGLFMKKFKVNKGMIITYNKKEKIKQNAKIIEVIPSYEYLLKNQL
ncbi:MAG: ATP-binding protein [Nanoarchaeota archaeon]|nr:ATP-binding protein [Nanoarchaeota archaeon]